MNSTGANESRNRLRRRTAAHLLMGASLAGLLLAAGYFFFVRTAAGQHWDNEGYAGRQAVVGEVRTFDSDILAEVSKQTLMISLGGLFVISLILRRPVVGLVAVTAAAAAIFGAEFLKNVLPRELLSVPTVPVPAYFSADTYPSGHTTVGTSLALACVLIFGAWLRPWLAVIAGLMSSSYATAVLFMGWHRPSDALGGIAWSGFCMTCAAALLVLFHGHHAPPAKWAAWIFSAAAAFLLIALLAFTVFSHPVDSPSTIPFFSMSAAIIVAGFALPAWLALALAHIDWRSSLHRE